MLPFAAFSKHRAVDLNVIGNKADSNAVGAFAVTVIVVIPYLNYRLMCFFNNVRVNDVVAVILCCVAFNGILCYRVSDLRVAVHYGKVFKFVYPTVIFGDGLVCYLNAVGVQTDGY